MWKFISISSFVIFAASSITYTVYRRCNPHNPFPATQTHDVMYDQTYYKSCSTNAYTPATGMQDWTAWQLHASVSSFLSTTHQLTTEQQRRLLFMRWLFRSGKLTEFIDIVDIEV